MTAAPPEVRDAARRIVALFEKHQITNIGQAKRLFWERCTQQELDQFERDRDTLDGWGAIG